MSDGLFYQVMMKSGTSLENSHAGNDEKPKTKMPLLATIPYYFLLQVTRYHLLGLGMAHLLGETIYCQSYS